MLSSFRGLATSYGALTGREARNMSKLMRKLVIVVTVVAALAAAPTALADHSPYAHLTQDLLLPHQ